MIHVVYVIRPAGFFQKAISEVSSKFFKEEFKFRLMVCSTLDDLFAHVERSQVTQDLGGELMYSHHEWIQQRIVSILILFVVFICYLLLLLLRFLVGDDFHFAMHLYNDTQPSSIPIAKEKTTKQATICLYVNHPAK